MPAVEGCVRSGARPQSRRHRLTYWTRVAARSCCRASWVRSCFCSPTRSVRRTAAALISQQTVIVSMNRGGAPQRQDSHNAYAGPGVGHDPRRRRHHEWLRTVAEESIEMDGLNTRQSAPSSGGTSSPWPPRTSASGSACSTFDPLPPHRQGGRRVLTTLPPAATRRLDLLRRASPTR